MTATVTDAPAKTWVEYLDRKGVRKVAERYGAHCVSGNYFQYPCVDEQGEPYKNPLGQEVNRLILWNRRVNVDEARFLFTPRKPEGYVGDGEWSPRWFTPKGLWEAVKTKNGNLIVTSGETDMWSLNAIGKQNVTTFYGETNYFPDLPERLKRFGVIKMHYYPDQDFTGLMVACNLHLLFQRAGMKGATYTAYRIPDVDAPFSVKDLNDAYRAFGFDADKLNDRSNYEEYTTLDLFQQFTSIGLLDADNQKKLKQRIAKWQADGDLDLIRLDKNMEPVLQVWQAADMLPAPPKPKTTQSERTEEQKKHDAEVTASVWLLIEAAWQARTGKELRYDGDGWSQNVECPFGDHQHDKSSPAFAINNQTASWKCFKCDRTGGWKELAEVYHIQWQTNSNNGLKQTISGLSKNVSLIRPDTTPQAINGRFRSAQSLVDEAISRARAWRENPRTVRGLPFGFSPDFDTALQGLWRDPEGDFITFIAPTGVGKSTVSLQVALQLSLDAEVYYLSPEMTPEMQMLRLGCIAAGYNIHEILQGAVLDMDRMERDYRRIIHGRNLFFMDGYCSILELPFLGDYVASRRGVLVVDPLQAIVAGATGADKWVGIETAMYELERISAMIPIIGTAQTNRDSAGRGDKSTQIFDVAGGQSIVNLSKRVIGLDRPWIAQQTRGDKSERAAPNEVIAKVLKDRLTGQTGREFPLQFGNGNGGYGIYGVGDDVYPQSMVAYDELT